MKKIGIVFNGLYVGGAEKFGISLANKFAEDGTSVTLFFFRDIKSPLLDEIDARIEKVYFSRKSKYHINFSKTFNENIHKKGIQKVFIIGLMPLLFTRLFEFKKNKTVDYFLSLHSTIPANFKTYIRNLLLLKLARKSDKVIFVCKNQYQFYKQKYFFNPKKYQVIYNGIDTEYFKNKKTEQLSDLRKSFNIREQDKVITLVATVRAEKGHDDAIKALKLLHDHHPDKKNTHLLIVGSGKEGYLNQLKQTVNSLGLESYIHFAGNQKDVRPYHSISHVFTLTSFSTETFSIAALEAMSMGLPLSLTNIGGASEMVREGENGILSIPRNPSSIAESWNKILEANLNADKIRQIAVELFSVDKMFDQYKKAIG